MAIVSLALGVIYYQLSRQKYRGFLTRKEMREALRRIGVSETRIRSANLRQLYCDTKNPDLLKAGV